ncbi:hypothetical protein [Rhodopila sp.]|uniref:hypothetical protein n=1 Tax=Rhodopila sp. TaxID=2480087 RepID=UPI003D10D6F7
MSEDRRQLTVRLSDDNKTVVVEFLPASGATGLLSFKLAEFTDFIRGLGAVRQLMVAGEPAPSLQGANIQAAYNTSWHIQPDALSEGSALTFYHPAFGPVGLVVPKEQIPAIVSCLTAHLGIHTSPEGRPN